MKERTTFMGLAASQAKLLSITSRLSDNELRSQSLTAAKLALSSQTADASRKYINALNRNELVYRTYDEAGNKVFVPLTGAQLTSYGEIKNQYGIINNKGQILVSETDAANYKDSANVLEFIQKYGFSNEFKEYEYEQINYDQYNADLGQYQEQLNGYNQSYEEYTKAHEEWENSEPQQSDFMQTITEEVERVEKYHPNPEPPEMIPDPDWVDPSTTIGEEDPSVETWSLYEAFMNGTAGGCFTCSSLKASSEYNVVRHFNHVLGHLSGGVYSEIWEGDFWWSTPVGGLNGTSGDGRIMREIAAALVGKTACGEQGCNETHHHSWQYTQGLFDVDFDCGDENCDGSELVLDKIKNLMQDIDDYTLRKTAGNGGDRYNYTASDTDPEWIKLKQRYYHLIEHDLKGILEDINIPKEPIEPQEPPLIPNPAHEEWENEWEERVVTETVTTEEPDEEGYNKAYEEWLEKEPQEPEYPENLVKPNPEDYKEKLSRVEQDLKDDTGRWYIDLWHRMNGMSNYKVTMDDFDNGVHDPSSDGVIEGANVKSPTNGRTVDGLPLWDVLEDGLMNSQEWLKYALETGTVTLERVNYTNPTEYGTGMEPLNNTWTSILYTNALEISQQVNDRAISIAEAEYEQKTREIEAKDKQYDSMLKLLDTEHSALQQEYESAKAVIQKNTERTLKIYSA